MKKNLLILAVAALAFASCSNDETVAVNNSGGNEISFRPLVTGVTRTANAAGLKSAFENGDIINVYADYNSGKYFQEDFTSNGTTFSSTNKYYWPSDVATKNITFTAIWGATQKANTPGNIDDFTPAAAAASQKDVLLARHTSSTKESPVAMNFRHALSQIYVRVKNSNPNLEVQIYGVRVGYISTQGDFNYDKTSTGAVTTGAGHIDQSKWTNEAAVKSNKYDQASTKTITGTLDVDAAPETDGDDNALSSFTPWLLLPQNMVTDANSYGYNTASSSASGTDPDLATSYIALEMEIRNYNGASVTGTIVSRQWCYWPITTNWNPGYKYTYMIDVAGGGYQPIDTEGNDKALDPVLAGAVITFNAVSCTIDAWTDAAGIDVP